MMGYRPETQGEADAIAQDVADLIERMRTVYKDKPVAALVVMANAFGPLIAQALGERCGCGFCLSDTLAQYTEVVRKSAMNFGRAIAREAENGP